MKISVQIIAILLISIGSCLAGDSTEYKTIIPRLDYCAGSAHRFMFGDAWRDLWATPIRVRVLDFDAFAGGLQLVERGGGMQTRSLKFRGADGKIYKFRSIQKFTDVYIPDELKNTLVDDVAKDLFSSANPVSAILSDPFANAVGVMSAKPIMTIMPDDERLGEHREDFAGLLGTIEVHPDEYDDEDVRSFADADKVFGTLKLYERLLKKKKYRIDAAEFLKARTLDFFLGDWDRHFDQWRWARYDSAGLKICRPIARDRDQAFCRFDGVVPTLETLLIPQIESCDEEFPPVEFLSWSGRYLDRKFLAPLEKPVWDSVVARVVASITDALIDSALSIIPAKMYEKEGARLRRIMRSRRDKLADFADDFYYLLAEQAVVWAANKDEIADITRFGDGSVNVKIYNRDDGEHGELKFNRTYKSAETKEIRVYLHDGDDIARVSGSSRGGIKLYIVGGDGADEFVDESEVVEPCPFAPFIDYNPDMTIFLDDGKKSRFAEGVSTAIETADYPEFDDDDLEFYENPVRDWGWDWAIQPWFSYDSDEGVFLGAGPVYSKYGFRRNPYYYQLKTRIGYSFLLNGFKAEIAAIAPSIYKDERLEFKLRASQIDISKFFGHGNETKRIFFDDDDRNDFDDDYYKLDYQFVSFGAAYFYGLSKNIDFFAGAELRSNLVEKHDKDSSYYEDFKPYGGGAKSLAALRGGLKMDLRDSKVFPRSGLFCEIESAYFPKIFNNKRSFFNANFDLRAYYNFDLLTEITLGARVGGVWTGGGKPFYEAAFVGGSDNLRGYERNRYAGDKAVFSSLEVKAYLFPYKVIVPGKVGLTLLSDQGRVFLDGEKSKVWHKSFGAGLWLGIYNETLVFSVDVVRGEEKTGFYFKAGYDF